MEANEAYGYITNHFVYYYCRFKSSFYLITKDAAEPFTLLYITTHSIYNKLWGRLL